MLAAQRRGEPAGNQPPAELTSLAGTDAARGVRREVVTPGPVQRQRDEIAHRTPAE